ncbi:uncharacterized protein [Oscarella lobularis]|uniref:uncharacterized protein n=1 Tax=Oscarella lobularis TaxID=121494 RepID=UPI0033137D99
MPEDIIVKERENILQWLVLANQESADAKKARCSFSEIRVDVTERPRLQETTGVRLSVVGSNLETMNLRDVVRRTSEALKMNPIISKKNSTSQLLVSYHLRSRGEEIPRGNDGWRDVNQVVIDFQIRRNEGDLIRFFRVLRSYAELLNIVFPSVRIDLKMGDEWVTIKAADATIWVLPLPLNDGQLSATNIGSFSQKSHSRGLKSVLSDAFTLSKIRFSSDTLIDVNVFTAALLMPVQRRLSSRHTRSRSFLCMAAFGPGNVPLRQFNVPAGQLADWKKHGLQTGNQISCPTEPWSLRELRAIRSKWRRFQGIAFLIFLSQNPGSRINDHDLLAWLNVHLDALFHQLPKPIFHDVSSELLERIRQKHNEPLGARTSAHIASSLSSIVARSTNALFQQRCLQKMQLRGVDDVNTWLGERIRRFQKSSPRRTDETPRHSTTDEFLVPDTDDFLSWSDDDDSDFPGLWETNSEASTDSYKRPNQTAAITADDFSWSSDDWLSSDDLDWYTDDETGRENAKEKEEDHDVSLEFFSDESVQSSKDDDLFSEND